MQVAVLEHVIAVCRHLREKGDFLSLKYLLSAVRASVSQRHQTHVSWKVTVQGMACKSYASITSTGRSSNKCLVYTASYCKL